MCERKTLGAGDVVVDSIELDILPRNSIAIREAKSKSSAGRLAQCVHGLGNNGESTHRGAALLLLPLPPPLCFSPAPRHVTRSIREP